MNINNRSPADDGWPWNRAELCCFCWRRCTFDTGGATITLENVSMGVGPAGYDSLVELGADYTLVVVV